MNKAHKTKLQNIFAHTDLSDIHDFRNLSGIWLRATFKINGWNEANECTETYEVKVHANETYQQAIERLVQRLKDSNKLATA